ncbi:MAG: hypothetical protein WAJ88_02615 [Pseudolabrys sp.]
MKAARVIFALLIAVSVVVLPAAGGVGSVIKSTETTDMAAMEDMDCCPRKVNPCDKAIDGCSSMATCALKCFMFSGAASSPIAFSSRLVQLNPAFGTDSFNSQIGNPPFRPPRV